MTARRILFALLVFSCAALASAAPRSKRAKMTTPPSVAKVRADTIARTRAPANPVPLSRTPGPTIRPGSPIEDRTTIAPFPVPGDTSRAASERAKMMNVPRFGETLLGPPPRGSMIMPIDPMDTAPEQLTPIVPVYPKAARDAGIQGTVMVMARVMADGTVGETRVVKSIPGLDEAAVLAVKRLRFKPASYRGNPVAVWVGVPVRFTLH